jgi:hypothetical protein
MRARSRGRSAFPLGITVYFGSLALTMPASKTPKRVSSEPAASSVPDATAPRRVRPADVERLADDAVTVLHLVHHGQLDRRSGHHHLARRPGFIHWREDHRESLPAAIAEPANRNGNSSCSASHDGTAVLAGSRAERRQDVRPHRER